MTWKEKLHLAWTNKGTIAEGFFNAYVSCGEDVKAEALKRLEICRTNQCGLYNPKGENTETLRAAFTGKESCGSCGCALYEKAHAMSAYCPLKDLNDLDRPPLWDAVLTPEQENEINETARRNWEQRNQQNQK